MSIHQSPRPVWGRTRLALCAIALAAAAARPAAAQDSSQARTILVDEGGSYEVPVHPDFVTVLYLSDRVVKALASDTAAYEVKPIASTTIAIRPLRADARPANLSLATETIRVSIILRIAARREQALTQVTFKRADVEPGAAARRPSHAHVRAHRPCRLVRLPEVTEGAWGPTASGFRERCPRGRRPLLSASSPGH